MQNIGQRRNRCSFCRREGHNRLRCDDPRLIEFEFICADKCQTMSETEFYDWLSETNDSVLLKTYAAKKTRIPFDNIRNISVYKDAITIYIYETYKYQHNVSHVEDDFESRMNASLQNDIRSTYFFLEMIHTILLRREEQSRKFSIQSILQEDDLTKEIGECCICFENYNKSEFVALNCNHEFCNSCLKKALTSDNRPKPCCAYCRTEVTTMISRTNKVYNEMADLITEKL
jgi:hypothetical protein